MNGPRAHRRWGISALLVTLIGCASVPRSPGVAPARVAPVGPEPTTIEEAQADIDRWRAQLEPHPTAPSGAADAPPGGGPAVTAPQPTAPPPGVAAQPNMESDASTKSEERDAGGVPAECVTPCRAIASMRRSVAALCRLAGETDARCIDARKTLESSERRVARCGC